MSLQLLGFAALGVVTGILGGIVGIGGGIIVVPALVFGFGFGQHLAQGTSLAALLPPVGLFAVLQYYKRGQIQMDAALCIALGFFIGGWLGGRFAGQIPVVYLQRIFGMGLVAMGIKLGLASFK